MDKRAWIATTVFAVVILALGIVLFSPEEQAEGQRSRATSAVIEGTEVDLSFKMGGSIEMIAVEEGDEVKAGQLLATLNSEELLTKKAQAEAAYHLAQVKLEQAKQGVALTDSSSSAQVEQAQAVVEAAKAQLAANEKGAREEEIAQLTAKQQAAKTAMEIAQVNLERMQKLFAEGAVSKASLEEAQIKFEQAQAEFKAVDEQLKMAKSGSRQEEIDAARAQLEQAQAAYEQAVAGRDQVALKQLDVQSAEAAVRQAKGALDEVLAYLDNTRLTAPVDGIVKSVNVHKGELVSQGFTVLTLQAKTENYAKFYVDEFALGDLQTGESVKLFVPALGKEVEGKVASIAPSADFAVKKATQQLGERDIRSFAVKVTVSDPALRPGLTVEWRLEGADAQ